MNICPICKSELLDAPKAIRKDRKGNTIMQRVEYSCPKHGLFRLHPSALGLLDNDVFLNSADIKLLHSKENGFLSTIAYIESTDGTISAHCVSEDC